MKKLCDDHCISFEDIQNRSQALQARMNHAHTTQGVFMINRKYARGYDIKLKTEPLVMVLVNDEKMTTA